MMFPFQMFRNDFQQPPSSDNETDVFGKQLPEVATNLEIVDTVIAKQMMELSVEDRERSYMDVHGVKENKDEESEHSLEAGLAALEHELQKLEGKLAYDLALSMDPKYVKNRDFQLAFLRADLYDPAKAALRIVRHFQIKMELFGQEKLAMDIVQDDLDKECMETIYFGRGQMLNGKDRAGRTIAVVRAGNKYGIAANLKRTFYNGMVQARDPVTQVKGIVVVSFAFGAADGNMMTQGWGMSKLLNALPLRFEAMHICHDKLIAQALVAVIKTALGPFMKIRTRTHYGTHKETLESLATFGINPNEIPISEEGEITNLESYHQRLRKQRARERLTQPKRNRIYVPSDEDVLLGKGVPFQNHPGNERFRTMIVDRLKDYEKASKKEKVQIAKDILNTVHQNTGLFLRKDGDAWVCVADDIAHQKISTTFRSYRRNVKAGQS